MQKKNILFWIIIFFIILLVLFFLVRLISQKEIDDVHPAIPCEQEYLKKSDVLWVIPLYNNESIAQNKTWCASINAMNKTVGMHGVYHTYQEFLTIKDRTYLEEGVTAFEQCFGYKPSAFKAPQLALSKENKDLIKEKNWKIHGKIRQAIHKVYHCNDTGRFSNKVIKIF